MFLSDRKLLEEIDFLKASGRIKTKQEAYDVMGLDRQRVNNIKNQDKYKQAYHFSAENIRLFCEAFKIDANKIMGLKPM